MFQILMRINRYGGVAAATLFLLALLLPALQSMLSLDTLTGLRIYAAILAGMMLADKPLAGSPSTRCARKWRVLTWTRPEKNSGRRSSSVDKERDRGGDSIAGPLASISAPILQPFVLLKYGICPISVDVPTL